jgi:hypothetical protein
VGDRAGLAEVLDLGVEGAPAEGAFEARGVDGLRADDCGSVREGSHGAEVGPRTLCRRSDSAFAG